MIKSKTLILSLVLCSLLIMTSMVSALSFSQSFSQDLVQVREKWSYAEDTTGKLRGFNLVHTFFVPRQELNTYVNEKPTNTNTQNQRIVTTGYDNSIGMMGRSNNPIYMNGNTRTDWLGGSIDKSQFADFGSSNFGGNNFEGFGGNDYRVNDAFNTFGQNNRGYPSNSNRYNGGMVGFRVGY